MDLYDEIYYSLIGQMEPGLSWVPDAFAPGSVCEVAYDRLVAARDRVLAKLGQGDDPDLEQMLMEMDTIQHALCRQIISLLHP